MVAAGEAPGAALQQLLGDLGSHPEPAGRILTVDDDEIRPVRAGQVRRELTERSPARLTDDVSDSENPHAITTLSSWTTPLAARFPDLQSRLQRGSGLRSHVPPQRPVPQRRQALLQRFELAAV